MITRLDIEPIKTAVADGDVAGARRLRLQLLRDIIGELRHLAVTGTGMGDAAPGWLERLADSACDDLAIPDE